MSHAVLCLSWSLHGLSRPGVHVDRCLDLIYIYIFFFVACSWPRQGKNVLIIFPFASSRGATTTKPCETKEFFKIIVLRWWHSTLAGEEKVLYGSCDAAFWLELQGKCWPERAPKRQRAEVIEVEMRPSTEAPPAAPPAAPPPAPAPERPSLEQRQLAEAVDPFQAVLRLSRGKEPWRQHSGPSVWFHSFQVNSLYRSWRWDSSLWHNDAARCSSARSTRSRRRAAILSMHHCFHWITFWNLLVRRKKVAPKDPHHLSKQMPLFQQYHFQPMQQASKQSKHPIIESVRTRVPGGCGWRVPKMGGLTAVGLPFLMAKLARNPKSRAPERGVPLKHYSTKGSEFVGERELQWNKMILGGVCL